MQSARIRAKEVVIEKKWLYLGKSVSIRATLLYLGKSGSIRAKYLYSGKVVVFGQSCCNSSNCGFGAEVFVIGQKRLYSKKTSCICANVLLFG